MFSLGSLKHLLPYIRPDIRWLYFSLAMALPLSVLRVGPIPMVKYLVDEVLVYKRASSLIWVPIGVVVLYLLNLGVRFLHYYAIRIVVIRTNQRLKEKLYSHLLSLSTDYFSNQKAGMLLSRVTADPALLDNGIASFSVLLREPITFAALFGYALYTNWKLTLMTLVIVPLLGFVFGRTGKYIKGRIAEFQIQNGESYALIQESIAGVRVLHLFQAEKLAVQKFIQQMGNISNVLLKISKMEELASPMVELVTSFAIALILYFGGTAVLNGEMTSGELIAFFTAFGMMINPIRQVTDINTKLHTASAAMDRILEFLSWKSNIQEISKPLEKNKLERSIQFKNVSFQYPDEKNGTHSRKVLENVNFELERGKTIALVGQSGSGKSSIAQLISRAYDCTEGEILIDGTSLKHLKLDSWRSCVSVVSQDVFLFHDTIYNNILMGNPSASRDQVFAAAQKAFATDFILKTPEQFETIIGDRGVKLSGGERQRLSIARAFLKNSDLLILDEATSNLDNESEKIVQNSLEELMKNRTTLIIAHRLSTIKNADEIIVLREGKIVERGRFDSLIQAAGEFKRLAQLDGTISS